MKKLALDHSKVSPFNNHGDSAEFHARYTLTGMEMKTRNVTPFWVSGDIGGLQVKSSAATICKGYDLTAHMAADAAESYGYVINDYSAIYIMAPAEYKRFVKEFGSNTHNSKGEEVIRLAKETLYLRQWLETQVNGRDYRNGRYWLG